MCLTINSATETTQYKVCVHTSYRDHDFTAIQFTLNERENETTPKAQSVKA